jgi:hypothetical protein
MSGTIVKSQAAKATYKRVSERWLKGSFWSPAQRATPIALPGVGPVTVNLGWQDTRTTSKQTPFWRNIMRAGNNATTDLDGSLSQLHPSSGTFQYREKVGVGTATEYHDVHTWSGQLLFTSASFGGFVSGQKAEDLATEEFIKQARKAQTQLQAGVIAGEAMQTIRGVLQTARTIRNGLFGYLDTLAAEKRRRRRKTRRELTEYVSDQWLSASYGWKPLLGDLDDSMKYLATDNEVLSEHVRVSGKSSLVGKGFQSNESSPSGCTFKSEVQERVSVRIVGKVSRKVNGFALFGDAMSARAGLDPSNWLPTIWELIPYSFLVDYFSNVQEVISSYTFNQQSVMWANKTLRRVVKTYGVNPVPPAALPVGATIDIFTPGNMTWEWTQVIRRGGIKLETPDLRLELPPFGSLKWLNMAALIAKSKAMSPYVW